MALDSVLAVLLFVGALAMLLSGVPVAFALAGWALIVAGIGWAAGAFDPSILGALPSRIYGAAMMREVLVAVPLFIFMGVMLERSKIADELLQTLGALMGRMPGGLGLSVTLVGALLAASTGIVGATVVTMGLLALPTMLNRGYAASHACGSIAAAGTLGQIIPPSIVLVLLGDQISTAYNAAQRELGNWAPDPVSVGDLFAGALLPGLLLVALYVIYQIVFARLRPHQAPATSDPGAPRPTWRHLRHALLPPLALILAVLGSILGGIATPTEAAAIGAVGAILLAGIRRCPERRGYIIIGVWAGIVLVAVSILAPIQGDLMTMDDGVRGALAVAGTATMVMTFGLLQAILGLARATGREKDVSILTAVCRETLALTAMVFLILIAAGLFALVFRGLEGDRLVAGWLADLPGGAVGAMLIVMAIMFALGFFLDFLEITFVVVPIVAPALFLLGLDPVWVGVMMAVNLQTSFLTPPFGFSLFYLRGVAPDHVKTTEIYKGALPFVLMQLVGLGLIAAFPALATWLPGVVFD